MPTVLLTAFEPYDSWSENSSWLTLAELARDLPAAPRLITRRYPVDYPRLRARLEQDLAANFDYVVHLGQAPGSGCVRFESIGLNILGQAGQLPEDYQPLVPDAPLAYQSDLPLARWAAALRELEIPAHVSYSAGTYLCNAAFYLSQHIAATQKLKSRVALLHLPLESCQVLREHCDKPALPRTVLASAVRLVLDQLAGLAETAPNAPVATPRRRQSSGRPAVS